MKVKFTPTETAYDLLLEWLKNHRKETFLVRDLKTTLETESLPLCAALLKLKDEGVVEVVEAGYFGIPVKIRMRE